MCEVVENESIESQRAEYLAKDSMTWIKREDTMSRRLLLKDSKPTLNKEHTLSCIL